jgi:hypothetical protein
MPLPDHFRPPVSKHSSWEGFHGMWPATMVQEFSKVLPEDFTAEPRVHLGTAFEVDVCAYEDDEEAPPRWTSAGNGGGVATAAWAPPKPTLDVEAEFEEQYEYEVLIYDQNRGRELVAAIEIVSPANKDRPQSRQVFVTKCAALLQKRVCVSIVDLVTTRHFNLYSDLLDLIRQSDPTFVPTPATYAVTCRNHKVGRKPHFQTWSHRLEVGQRLPALPICLSDASGVLLDLEASYEAVCQALRIR